MKSELTYAAKLWRLVRRLLSRCDVAYIWCEDDLIDLPRNIHNLCTEILTNGQARWQAASILQDFSLMSLRHDDQQTRYNCGWCDINIPQPPSYYSTG